MPLIRIKNKIAKICPYYCARSKRNKNKTKNKTTNCRPCCCPKNRMTLDKVKKGQHCRVVSIPDAKVRARAMRHGIAEGELIACDEIIPAGPIILRKRHQQIALGRQLACSIVVE